MRIRTLLAVAFIAFVVTATVTLRGTQPSNPGPAPGSPAQPIAFSHRLHVGTVGIECQFCHAYARRGPVAGIPSVARCSGCHAAILPSRPEIEKILAYEERGEPIPWVRIHDLPDYVRFTHKRHLAAGLGCTSCHGEVGQMETTQQVSPLSMGWCLSCHEQRQASVDCLICHY